jgi:4,5-DOPA dioxygenase extradiol
MNQKEMDKPASTEPMPVLFIGHGSPMNAIEDNEFSKAWREVAKILPKPKAILCISAHWETRGTLVTAMETPRTIHDFGGFPPALFEVRYLAPGSPWLAREVKDTVSKVKVGLDQDWALGLGSWLLECTGANVPCRRYSCNPTKSGLYQVGS